MQALSRSSGSESPENLIDRLARQLRQHAVWDLLLVILPPAMAAGYCLTTLYRTGWISPTSFAVAVFAVAALAVAVPAVSFLRQTPPRRTAAGLMDQRAGANDRFITLATIEAAAGPASLVSRLRAEVIGFVGRIHLERDFPYAVKRSFYWSFVASIAVAMIFRIALPFAQSTLYPPSGPERLRALAERMAERPRLTELVRKLQALAATLEKPNTSIAEKQAALQEVQKAISQEQGRDERQENSDVLAEAASTVKNMDQQGEGEQQKQDQTKGGGGELNSNLPREGQQQATAGAGSGEGKGEAEGQLSKDMQKGQGAQGAPNEPGKEANQQRTGEGKLEQSDARDGERQKDQETAGKTQGNREDRGGKSKASEEIPQGAPPAERMGAAGEGKDGIKGARYVTVQLPEEAAAESQGERAGSAETKGNRVGQKLPVSNTPLPAHLPDAPSEKQNVPLEYRGILR